MSDVLEALFGSRVRTRLLRFFLLNPEAEHSAEESAKRNMVNVQQARKELQLLKKIKFVSEKVRRGKKVYVLNPEFHFYPELKNLVAKSNAYPQCQSLAKLKSVGDVKLVLLSGTFLNYPKSKADMVLVVNNTNRARLKAVMHSLEAEIGKEVNFLLMNSDEFKYRVDMLDRFLLDFLEGPHEEVINKIPTLKRFIANLKKH